MTKLKGACLLFMLWSTAWTSVHAGSPSTTDTSGSKPEPSSLEKFFMQDYLTGSWGGLRTDLSNHGLDFEFFYIGSSASNLAGGIKEGTVYEGALLLAADVDFGKMGAWQGGHFHVSSVWLDGRPFSQDYVGDLNKTNLVDFPRSFRLWEVWYSQNLFDDQLVIKVGQMSVDRDFIVPELYNNLASINFLNQTFFYPTLAFDLYDIPGFPKGNHALPSTPYASLGALVRWQPTKSFYAQAAVYDGNPDLSSSGTRISLSGDQGALVYFELGYKVNDGKDATGLPGSYKIGGYYHSDDFYDLRNTIGGVFGFASPAPSVHHGNYGAYMLAEQMLFREGGKADPAQQGLIGFFRLAAAPADRNLAEFGADAGLVYKGLIPSRDYDTIGVGASYLKLSSDLRDAQRIANTIVPGSFVPVDYETVFELNYKAQIAAWWTLQPSVQYVMHPGGSKALDNSWVFILQTTLRF